MGHWVLGPTPSGSQVNRNILDRHTHQPSSQSPSWASISKTTPSPDMFGGVPVPAMIRPGAPAGIGVTDHSSSSTGRVRCLRQRVPATD